MVHHSSFFFFKTARHRQVTSALAALVAILVATRSNCALVCYMQTSCRQTSAERASTSGRGWQSDAATLVHAAQSRSVHSHKLCKPHWWANRPCSHPSPGASSKFHSTAQQTRRLRPLSFCAQVQNGTSDSKHKGLVIVIDNYDSFTYNICQVTTLPKISSVS